MGSLLVALPIVCCILIPAAAFVFWGWRNRSTDKDGQREDPPHLIERDHRK